MLKFTVYLKQGHDSLTSMKHYQRLVLMITRLVISRRNWQHVYDKMINDGLPKNESDIRCLSVHIIKL